MAEETKTTKTKAAPKAAAAKPATKAAPKTAAKATAKPVTKAAPKKKVTKKQASTKAKKSSGPSINVYSLGGSVLRQTDLPDIFQGDFRPDLIRRAVKSAQGNRRQPYGPGQMAGMRHAASQWGKGRGTARVQRMTQGRTAVESPPNVGGRRAHPPKPEKDWSQKINKKEKRLAMRSALASLTNPELVRARGHQITDDMTLPLVIEDRFESLSDEIIKDNPNKEDQKFTKETIKILSDLGLENEIQRSVDGKHVRPGKGKMRGRRYKRPKSILFVVSEKDNVAKCVRNIPGVDVATPAQLSVELLAPGGDPGRLAIFTESALKALGE